MADIQAAHARSLVSPVWTTLFGVGGVVACVALAGLESYAAQAIGFEISAFWFVALVALNLFLLAFLAFRSDRFRPRWLAAGATTGLILVAGVFLLIQSAFLTAFIATGSSPPTESESTVAGGSAPTSSQLNVPPAPASTALPSSRPTVVAKAPPPSKEGRPASFDDGGELLPRDRPAGEKPAASSAPTIPAPSPVAPAPPVASAPPPAAPSAPSPLGPIVPSAGFPRVDGRLGDILAKAAPPIDLDGKIASAFPPSGGGYAGAPGVPGDAGGLIIDKQVAAPPQPGPTPSANTTAPTPEPVNASAYWNGWFVDGTGPGANILIANNTYTYTLDVAAFNYALLRRAPQSSGVRADAKFEDMIADPKTSEVVLTIKPLVPEGSGLRLGDDRHSYTIKIDLDKIRHPDAVAAKKYADGSISITELSKQASAGSIQIGLTAESQGCATIAFAIFRGLQPLDHLVQRVSIGDTNMSAPVCDSADPVQANALSGGLNSLREVSLGMEGSGADVTAAAALHIFDFEAYSMAVFVDGRPGKTPVYGWQTASSVVDFLRTDRFQNMILKARKDSADKKPGSYLPAAKELAKVLFSTKPGNSTEDDAKNAWAALRAIVRESTGSPVVVVRVASDSTGGQNRSIYVPLGILGAKGADPVLEKPIIVVQPMAIERYPSRDKCIGDWMFAVPDGLENVPGAVMPPGFFPTKFPGMRISEIEKLRRYLAATTGSAVSLLAPPATAVGFVVLAHQDEGAMWFGESTDHIIPQDIEKRFPSGSVGIFAACSAASAKGRNTELLQRLNEQGVDTLIASPFTIDAGYGVVFASTFAEIMGEVASDKPPPTILELFDRTVSRTAQKFKDRADADYSELGLEYVLLGNPAIKLCVSP
ncbi:hypothetical protein [Bradyrhizobium sp. OK095]|uniref:hypothetical protein n=1 Tax=Bradyrhizobium sp. OK095 TaxID=1882760 RepID=UPI00115FD7F6|nr:hypothetical protein [Bradyrhizobium sp. OK095]